MIKLPEPVNRDDTEHGVSYVTEAQLKQAVRDALDEAAKVAQETVCDTHIPTGINIYGTRAAKAIRALIKQGGQHD